MNSFDFDKQIVAVDLLMIKRSIDVGDSENKQNDGFLVADAEVVLAFDYLLDLVCFSDLACAWFFNVEY